MMAQDLAIAAASDLQAALPEVVAEFQRATGRSVRVTYGSSGQFFAQIQNGAPFDLFFSADVEYPRRLEALGHADANTRYEYATGQLVLWATLRSGLDISRGLPVLQEARVRRVAIANPAHAPYGRAAVAALEHAGLLSAVRPKLVLGENIAQAAQFVVSGNAEAGIIALSVALTPSLKGVGTYISVPEGSYPPIEQAAVVLTRSSHQTASREFLDFMRRPGSQVILQRFGFRTPGAHQR